MKRMIFALIALTTAYAEPTIALVAKVAPNESQGYFVFSDGTFWKVSSFIKRWRTPLEWISGDEIYVPENYVCSVQDWSFADEFEAYPKYGNARVNESDASNEEDLKKHSHILVNIRTGKILFGTPVHPADFLVQVYDEGHHNGYNIGYSTGYNSGYAAGKAAAQQPQAPR